MQHNELTPSHNISVLYTSVVYKTLLYYGTDGVAVNVSTLIQDVRSLQEDCRAKLLQKHWVNLCKSQYGSYNVHQMEDNEANMCSDAT